MRRSLLAWYTRAVFRRRGWIVAASVVLTVLSVLISLRLEVRTSREELSDTAAPVEVAYDRFLEEFGSPNHLVIVVEPRETGSAPEPDRFRAFVTELAEKLRAERTYFHQVIDRLDWSTLDDQGLYFLPLDELERMS